ncbi:hypothetical protein Tco_0921933 [Tanacetum coccineum]|uniref:Uncharacterized protein n=1 Tax=Tanacetum coccineum TaxID=301880 RepID=A0ABQ5D354_9ASTR
MYYPRFTKAIIHHFITKDKSISMRNRMFMHTARDDNILGLMRFVSKSDDFQVYGALLPNRMTNQQMLDSYAYKTYLAYAIGVASLKMKMKFKKPASPSKKRTLVTIEEEEPKPAKKDKPIKKPPAKRQSWCVCETQLKKALKRSKRETSIHQAGGSSEGANIESKVPDEPKGKLKDTSEGTGLKPGVPDMSKGDSSESEYESWGDSGDEANVQDDEEVQESDDEPQHMINEELYGNVNVSLTDVEPVDKEKDDEEMSVVGHVNVNQEGAGNQVKDDAQATQKTDAPIPSSFISSDYTTKFLNFDNIPSINTEVISMMDINVQHEVPCTSSLLTIPVFDVKELKDVDNSSKVISTIKSEVPNVVKEYLGSNLDDALHKVIQRNFADIIKKHSVPAEIVERLRQQYAPQKSIEDIREIKMEHERKQQVPKETITSSDTTALEEFDQKTTLFETMTKSKSFNKSPKQRALYHALMESILKDEDAMDEGVVDKLKKRKPDDADKDEGPSAGSDRGLKRQKTSKDTEPSKKAKSTETFKGTSKSQPKSIAKSAQAEETVFKTGDTQGPQNLREETGNTDEPLIVNISELTQDILVGPAYNILKGTCRSYVELDYNMEECYKLLTDQLDWNNPEGDRYPFDLSKPLPLVMSENRQIVSVDYSFNNDLAYLQGGSTGRTYTTSLTKIKAAKYDLPGIEDMVPNLWSPVKVAYDKHALLGTSYWGPKRQRLYRYASNRVSKHEVYSTKRILAVTNVKVKEWYGYGHLEEIEVRGSGQQLYNITYVHKTYRDLKESGRPSTWCRKLPEEAQHLSTNDAQG